MPHHPLKTKHTYAAAVQLFCQCESISWDRFYNYLTGNSLLLVAWATIFATGDQSTPKTGRELSALTAFCTLGFIGGVVWSRLGQRGRKHVDLYRKHAEVMEVDAPHKPVAEVSQQTATMKGKPFGSKPVLTFAPLTFSWLYLGLGVLPWDYPDAYRFLYLGGFILGLIFTTAFLIAVRWYCQCEDVDGDRPAV